jgi:hypothetical protein
VPLHEGAPQRPDRIRHHRRSLARRGRRLQRVRTADCTAQPSPRRHRRRRRRHSPSHANVTYQYAPGNSNTADAIAQPLVFALNLLDHTLTGSELREAANDGFRFLSSASALPDKAGKRGSAALKMFFIAYHVIFTRPAGTDCRSDSKMLELARIAAASPQSLLDAAEALLHSAAPEPCDSTTDDADETLATDSHPPAAAAAAAAAAAPTEARVDARSRNLLRAGETRKAVRALAPAKFADPSDTAVQKKYAKLTPQSADAIPTYLLSDVPGVTPLQFTAKTLDALFDATPKRRAAGVLHAPYEVYALVWRSGARRGLTALFQAVAAGLVHDDIVDLLSCFRAVALYKDEACVNIRPLLIGEGLRRLITMAASKQERAT